MPQHPYKFKLLFDENIEPRKLFLGLNNFYNIRNLAGDYKKIGLKDPQVFELAKNQMRILITYNFDDFKNMTPSETTGVIGISHNLTLAEIDKKLMSFLKGKTKSELYGKCHYISGETK